jgi:hypothetical protein
MNVCLPLAVAVCFAALCFTEAMASEKGMRLVEYAMGHTIPVYTVTKGAVFPLEHGDQTNNLAEGDKVILLSDKSLVSLEGIRGLRVKDGDHETTVAEVPKLQLFLNSNHLHELPAEFFSLQNITFIYLNKNHFDAIPADIAKMHGLLGMYFTGNRISVIPPEVFTMAQLKKLQVSSNHLSEIPAAIGNLTRLMHLNLSDNAISTLPESIAQLTRLRVCDFSGNKIDRIPEAFGKVPIMHQLRIGNNPISHLPNGFATMPGTIDITGTQISLEDLSPALRARISREKHSSKASLVKRLDGSSCGGK